MGLKLIRRAELPPEQIARLEQALAALYTKPPDSYYQIADRAAQHYNTREQPFHCDLVERVFPGASVVEIGCGTAHLCPHVLARGGTYTGLDYSESLLEENRRRQPTARFLRLGTPLTETFDIVASLYTIEHVPDPPAYLETLWRYCRPGGLVAIICPEFIESPGLPPSVFFGRSPRRFQAKLRALDLIDAGWHLLDLKWLGPRWKKNAQTQPPGAFWINLLTAELHGLPHDIDTDAVHLPRLKDLVWWFEQNGGAIVVTSEQMSDIDPAVSRFNCYVVARKPERLS
ncbi:MAG: class I SAM-dependent methyltransferase [Limisphaerales bacterium]